MVSANTILYAFIIGILGVVTIGAIASQTTINTNPTTVSNEALSIATARLAGNNINESKTFTLANAGLADAGGWVINSVSITNASGTTLSGNFTVNYTSDTITFSNNTFMVTGGGAGNSTLVTYQYYQSSYLNSQLARSTFNFIPGFYALLILTGFVGLLYLSLRKWAD